MLGTVDFHCRNSEIQDKEVGLKKSEEGNEEKEREMSYFNGQGVCKLTVVGNI